MKQNLKTFLAGMFGNALEWYDFTLYAYFAVIFSHVFFPIKDENTALLTTFAVFALGFVVRPLGGLVIGRWADKIGRRKAMLITMSLITGSTLLTAILPSHQQIGLLAPILLTVARIIQGFAISGEVNTTAAFLMEHAKDNRRGLAGSLVMCSAFFGILVAAFTGTFMFSWFDERSLIDGAWRIPYFAGVLLGILGMIIRYNVTETSHFQHLQTLDSISLHQPIKILFSGFKKRLLLVVMLTSFMAAGNYFLVAYFPTFFAKQHFSLEMALWMNSTNMFIFMLLLPVFGLLSDKVGRKPVFIASIGSVSVLAVPIFWLLSQSSPVIVFIGELLFVICFAPITALIPTITAELFPTRVRSSGSAIGYNISLAIFGGTTPLIALTLVDLTGSTLAPAGYLITCALLSLAAILVLIETAHQPLHT